LTEQKYIRKLTRTWTSGFSWTCGTSVSVGNKRNWWDLCGEGLFLEDETVWWVKPKDLRVI